MHFYLSPCPTNRHYRNKKEVNKGEENGKKGVMDDSLQIIFETGKQRELFPRW